MGARNLAGERQADADAERLARVGHRARDERVEQRLADLVRHARAGVADGDAHLAVRLRGGRERIHRRAHGDRLTTRGDRHGVAHHVRDGTLEQRRVEVVPDLRPRAVEVEGDAALPRLRSLVVDRGLEHVGQGDPRAHRDRVASAQP
jgi:hypothetical protein